MGRTSVEAQSLIQKTIAVLQMYCKIELPVSIKSYLCFNLYLLCMIS